MRKLLQGAFCAFLPLAMAILASGCGDIVDPALEIPEKRTVAVVPFRDPQFDVGWESPLGRELAADVTKKLRDAGEFQVVAKDKVLALYNPNDEHAVPPTAREIAARLNADYVICGDITNFSTHDEGNVSPDLLHGQATIEVSVYETFDAAKERAKSDKEKDELPPEGHGRLVIAKKRVEAAFPRQYGMKNIGTWDMSPEQVEEGLKLAAAQQVAWIVLPHSKDEEKAAEGK